MSLLKWPFSRKQYPGIPNPRFVSDIVAANEAVLDAMIALTGLGPTDFAIISGFTYSPALPGSYTGGIFYLSGTFYYQADNFNTGFYLSPIMVDTMPQAFGDGNARKIYTLQSSAISLAPVANCPAFAGDMNQYRLSLKVNKTLLNGIIQTLKQGAFMDVGQIAGTLMAANDSRFLEMYQNVLLLNNTTPYTPTSQYNPATKGYVDSKISEVLFWSGVVSADGVSVTKYAGAGTVTASRTSNGVYRLTHNIGDSKYYFNAICIDTSSLHTPRAYYNRSSTSFDLVVADNNGLDSAAFQCTIHQYP